MKRQISIFSAVLLSLGSFAQGIEFEHGSWKDVLAKAKKTKKTIFVDVYTTWCGPCKKMSNEVFPREDVGKEYNANYICYKIDAEKGEGIKLAKQYGVNSYPTYLFLKPDGSLYMKAGGSRPAEEFNSLSQTAKDELANTKPLSAWDEEYAQKKSDPQFMLDYMDKRKKLGMSNAVILDEYLALLPQDERVSDEILDYYRAESRNIKITSLAYKNLLANAAYIYSSKRYIEDAINHSLKEAISSKDEQLLNLVLEENQKLPKKRRSKTNDQLLMSYYKGINDEAKYVAYATAYCESMLMTVSIDSIAGMDKSSLDQFNDLSKKGMYDGFNDTEKSEFKEYSMHVNRNRYSGELNSIAFGFFEKVNDRKALENALIWSKRSLEIYPDNHSYLDTYANLLYKLGRNEEAIAKEQQALTIAANLKSDTKVYEETLAKMKAGKQTWN